jgi:hypothetical protein
MLINVLIGIEHDQPFKIVGGIIIQFRFPYDIQTEFIHDICIYQPVLFQLLYIVIFQGILNVDQDVNVHVIDVFQVDNNVHVQLKLIHQLRHINHEYTGVTIHVCIQLNAQEYIFIHVNEYINVQVDVYIFVNGKLNNHVLVQVPKFNV